MSHVAFSAAEILIFTASLYGWGSLVSKWSYGPDASGIAYPSALGLAVLIAIGGVLNLFYLARPPVLTALLVIGLVLALYFAYRSLRNFPAGLRPARSRPKIIGNLVCLLFILVVFTFLAQALLPTRSFNFHDDYHMYFTWPVRMLQTGSLGGNPFDQLGFISLGAQSFLQGMYLTFSSIADLNGFDAILCLILTLWLLWELGERLGVHAVFILAAGLLALMINPQYVNVSSLYSGTLMLLGLTYGTMLLIESYGSPDSGGLIRTALPCGLFLAALLSLKTTFVFLVPLFWAVSLAVSLLLFRERKKILTAHFGTAAFSMAFLLPWLTLYLDRYVRKIQFLFSGIRYPSFSIPKSGPSLTNKEVVLSKLLSNQDLFWGSNFRDYLYADILLLAALAVSGWVVWRRRSRPETGVLLLPSLVLMISILGNYLCYYRLVSFRSDQIIRYSCPLLIAAVPMTVLLSGWLWREGMRFRREEVGLGGIFVALAGLLLVGQLAVAGLFRANFVERITRAEEYGSLISFPLVYNPKYISYNGYALSDEAAARISWLQDQVPAGESIFAWVSLPLYLDYRRNRIFQTTEYGISNPFLVMPVSEGGEGMRRFFRQLGIRYFIWEYRGYGMKPEARLAGLQRKFIQALVDMIQTSRIVFKDDNTIIFDIGHV